MHQVVSRCCSVAGAWGKGGFEAVTGSWCEAVAVAVLAECQAMHASVHAPNARPKLEQEAYGFKVDCVTMQAAVQEQGCNLVCGG